MKNLDNIIRQQNPSVVSIRNFNEFKDIDGNDVVVDMEKAQSEYDANQYQRDRQYPSIGDQLDMQYWDQVNGTTTWQDAIAKVKADNPKEAE
jgi:hypothetical protein